MKITKLHPLIAGFSVFQRSMDQSPPSPKKIGGVYPGLVDLEEGTARCRKRNRRRGLKRTRTEPQKQRRHSY